MCLMRQESVQNLAILLLVWFPCSQQEKPKVLPGKEKDMQEPAPKEDALAQAVRADIIESQINVNTRFHVPWQSRYYTARDVWESRSLASIFLGKPDPEVVKAREDLIKYNQEFYSKKWTTLELLLVARYVFYD